MLAVLRQAAKTRSQETACVGRPANQPYVDGMDCGVCVQGCEFHIGLASMVGNGVCNLECLNAACNADLGDCQALTCGPGIPI